MSELKVSGTITTILDVQTGKSQSTGEEWARTGFVIETEGEYPKMIAFTILGADKVDKFLQYNKEGDKVEVSFDPSSREYNGKYYTDLRAWKVWGLERSDDNPAPEPELQPEGEDDDLPF